MSGEAADDADAEPDASADAPASEAEPTAEDGAATGLDVDAEFDPEATTAAGRAGPVMARSPRAERGGADGEGSVRVVGTAHVSEASVREVEAVVEDERPDVVAVELDEGRFRQLRGETPDDIEAGDLLQGDTVFQFLAYWMLSYVQTRLGERFDIEPGAEMRAAIEAAPRVDAGVALVDRDIQVTIQRFWARMTALEKLRTVSALAFGAVSPPAVATTTSAVVGLVLGPLTALSAFLLGVPGATMARLVVGGAAGLGAGYVTDRLLREPAPDADPPADADDGPPGPESAGLASWTPPAVAAAVGVGAAVTGVGSGAVAGTLSGVFLFLFGGVALAAGLGLALGVGLGRAAAGATVETEAFDAESLTDADVVTALIEEFHEFSPGGASALIDERDAYIAHNLVWLREQGYDVVAVVGAGHRAGIQRYLDRPEELPVFADLVGRESGRRVSLYRVFGYLFTLGFLVFFGLLVLGGAGNALLVRLFGAWFLFNGVFAFAMAKLAGARWTSATVGGALAWFTSINPLLAPGWFAGYVELQYTTVNVADIGRLNRIVDDETLSPGELLRELLDVPLFRLIAVVGMTNVGSLVASVLFPFVVLPFVAEEGGIALIGDLVLQGVRNGLDIVAGVVA